MTESLGFARDESTVTDVLAHLGSCESDFVADLARRVSLEDYAEKLVARAVRFEAWNGARLVGLAALYANDRATRIAFVSHLSVSNGFNGRGVASTLMTTAIEYAIAQGMMRLELEVRSDNDRARALYARLGLVEVGDDAATTRMSMPLTIG